MPLALRVFFFSLLAGVGGGYVAFKVAFFIAMKFARGDYREAVAMVIALVAALLIGGCSAITAGVLAGRRNRDRGINT
jgi:hypothetical protein